MTQPIRVFLSYAHESQDHADRVRGLADSLRERGVDAWIDQYEVAPPQGWLRWMQDQVDAATFVLLVCTHTYRRRFEGREQPGHGRGVTWEGILASQILYEAGGVNERFIPVLFEGADEGTIPRALRQHTFHRLPEDLDALYRHLTGQPEVVPPPLGPLESMPGRSAGAGPLDVPQGPEDECVADELSRAHDTLDELREEDGDATGVRDSIASLEAALRTGPEPNPGEVLADGAYRLIERLGHGGKTTVWRAYDRRGRRDVAIKVLHGRWSGDPEQVEAFFAGARRLAALDHPSVVRVLRDHGTHAGFRFFVMEHVDGRALGEAVRSGDLTRNATLDLAVAMCDALGHAHDLGVVHGGLRPDDVLLDHGGSVRLTGFDRGASGDADPGTDVQGLARVASYALGRAGPDLGRCTTLAEARSRLAAARRAPLVRGIGLALVAALAVVAAARQWQPTDHATWTVHGVVEGLGGRTGCEVRVRDCITRDVDAATGRFTLRLDDACRRRQPPEFQVLVDRYEPFSQRIAVRSDGDEVRLRWRPVEKPDAVEGAIHWRKGGPLENAVVRVEGCGAPEKTRRDGRFRIPMPTNREECRKGPYHLRVTDASDEVLLHAGSHDAPAVGVVEVERPRRVAARARDGAVWRLALSEPPETDAPAYVLGDGLWVPSERPAGKEGTFLPFGDPPATGTPASPVPVQEAGLDGALGRLRNAPPGLQEAAHRLLPGADLPGRLLFDRHMSQARRFGQRVPGEDRRARCARLRARIQALDRAAPYARTRDRDRIKALRRETRLDCAAAGCQACPR